MSFLIGSAIIAAGTGAAIAGGTALANNRNRKAAERQATKIAGQQQIAAANLNKQLQETERPQKTAMVDRLMEMYSGDLGVTEAQMQLAQENIARGSASALRDVSSLGGGLRNVGQIQGQAADASQQLAATDAQMEQANRLSIGQALAQAEAEAEAYNELLPYEQKLAEYQAMLGASQQNQMLAAQMRSDRAAQNTQAGMDIGGSLIGVSGSFVGGLPSGGATGGTKAATTTSPTSTGGYQGSFGQVGLSNSMVRPDRSGYSLGGSSLINPYFD